MALGPRAHVGDGVGHVRQHDHAVLVRAHPGLLVHQQDDGDVGGVGEGAIPFAHLDSVEVSAVAEPAFDLLPLEVSESWLARVRDAGRGVT